MSTYSLNLTLNTCNYSKQLNKIQSEMRDKSNYSSENY